MPKTCAVEVQDLTRKFGDFTAVNQVTFHIEEGEIFGFLGPNGSGKTTTIRMLCGLLTPTAGAGRVLDLDIRTQSEAIKSRIGYMAQKFALYDDLTARENLDFYANIYDVPRRNVAARVRELIAMAGLVGRENERVGNLSGAWKQRLALGCAIVHRPKVLFLDEPTAGVDPVSRRHFWEMIYTLAGEGVTTFVTTHYMDEAERCNRVALMFDGRIIADGEPDVLKTKMPGALVEIEAQPAVEAMEVLRQFPDVQEVIAKGLLVHATLATLDVSASIPSLTNALITRGIRVARIEPIEPSLEDVFISLIEVERRAHARAAFEMEAP